MSKHTPGPWRVTELDLEYYGLPVIVAGAPDEQVMVAEVVSESPNSNADARLIAAAPDLLSAQTMGANMNTPDFLEWLAERLVHVYGESSNVDFVLSLKARAAAGRAAIAKATGAQL